MKIKQLTKKALQITFSLKTYLYCFSIYNIYTLYRDLTEKMMVTFLDLVADDRLIFAIDTNLGFATHIMVNSHLTPLADGPVDPDIVTYNCLMA